MSRKKNREYRDYIEDIYNDLLNIIEFTKGMSFPNIPFKQMAGLRDIVTHNYDGISYEMIWEVIKEDLLPIELELNSILSSEFK